mmetsp:Transcript_4723/g.7126  ORF Transcript_4723/g.7126 Transcript_4723/m.7126 type:complete len:138 (+) Transcript_4723:586-999(+)
MSTPNKDEDLEINCESSSDEENNFSSKLSKTSAKVSSRVRNWRETDQDDYDDTTIKSKNTGSRFPQSPQGIDDKAEGNPWLLGKIASFSTINIKSEYILSVSEAGKGMLHTISYKRGKEGKTNRGSRHTARKRHLHI